MALPYEQSEQYQKEKKKYFAEKPFDIATAAGKARFREASELGREAYDERVRGTRAEQFEETYGPTLEEKAAAHGRILEAEREKARNLAAGRLGYYQSAGAGTGGMWEANRLAMDKAFGIQAALDRIKVADYGAEFRLNWDLGQDRFDFQREMSRMQFYQQQQLLKQQAELNSASWWEQLGGIIGWGIATYSGAGILAGGGGSDAAKAVSYA